MQAIIMSRTEALEIALRRIIEARDEHAETGAYPTFREGGPGTHQDFDDWAANVADGALKYSTPVEDAINAAAFKARASRAQLDRHAMAAWFADTQPNGIPECMAGWFQEEDSETLLHPFRPARI